MHFDLESIGRPRPSRALRVAVLLALLVVPSWAYAEPTPYHEHVPEPLHVRGWTIPVELGQSAAWRKTSTGPRYESDLALLPGYRFQDRFSLHLGGVFAYRNPRWDGGPLARFDCLLTPAFGGFVPLRLLADGAYLFDAKGWRLESGLGVGLGTLLSVAVFGGYDTQRKAGFMHMVLAVDLLELSDPAAGITHYAPKEPR